MRLERQAECPYVGEEAGVLLVRLWIEAGSKEILAKVLGALHLIPVVVETPVELLGQQEEIAKGWSWLHDGQRHAHVALSMIVDAAHIVIRRALADGDHDLAREAADIVLLAAPHDDIPHIDYARVLTATGHQSLATKELDDHIHNRDDGDGPSDPPDRSRRAAG